MVTLELGLGSGVEQSPRVTCWHAGTFGEDGVPLELHCNWGSCSPASSLRAEVDRVTESPGLAPWQWASLKGSNQNLSQFTQSSTQGQSPEGCLSLLSI